MIFVCFTDDLRCAYSIIHLFKYFFARINKYLPVTYKEGPYLYYLNIHTIQSPYGIINYQTAHIQYTILAQWFTDDSEKVNSDTTPFKADIIFELIILGTLLATPTELHLLEERYLGKSSANIGKILQIMQYNCPDLMYSVNRLSIHNYSPSAP